MFKEWGKCVQKITDANGTVEVATLNCVPEIFLNILSALLVFAGLTALSMFILGGFKLMNSEGDAKKIEGARNNFKFGIIGLIIVLSSFLIINVISTVTGVECIKLFGFGCN